MKIKRIILLTGIVTAIVAMIVTHESKAQEMPKQTASVNIKMHFEDVYPVFIVKNLKTCKEFYGRWFDMNVVFEAEFFLLLSSSDGKHSIGFLNEIHPSSPPSAPAMNSKAGVFITLQVADAKADYERLKNSGLTISYALKDEPWGQRRFGITDPNGMYIDVVQQIEPEKGFWEKYPAKN